MRPLASAVGLMAAILAFAAVPAAGTAEEEIETCLACHGETDLTKDLPDGRKISLHVDRDAVARSVHGKSLRCTDCHSGMVEVPHPERTARNAEEFRSGFREACKPCHLDKYSQSLDGVHAKVLAAGNQAAPVCTDCHGAHDVAPAAKPRTRISHTCSACHPDVADTYLKSVHGNALAKDGNGDVPVCTDCHRAHDISDPRIESWLVKTPELCARCHTDAKMMGRYGLSTNVVQTYLSDFHGVTATLTRSRHSGARSDVRVTALCIDCHGVHDIAKTGDARSPVLRANLVKTCRKCHPTAGENFPDAWLSHYEPSWSKAPAVHAVKVFYGVFIPFLIGGLCLQILLQLWRIVVNR